MSRPAGDEHPRPVFIAGCGRSGTSLLRTLIDGHPDVYIPSESLFIPDYLLDGDRLPPGLLSALLFHEPQLLCWYDGPTELRGDVARTIATIHDHMASRNGASTWGQKTPRFVRHRDLIDHALGPCNWLLVYRDPRAVCASMRRSGQHSSSVSRACSRWKRDNQEIVRLVESPTRCLENIHLVRYETLVSNPEASLARILEFLQLRQVALDELLKNTRPVFFSRSRFENNTIPNGVLPDPSRISDWQSVLSPSEVSYIESTCLHEMEVLGYSTVMQTPGRGIPATDAIERVRDIRIVLRYLAKWPTYPLYTGIRKLVLGAYRKWPVE